MINSHLKFSGVASDRWDSVSDQRLASINDPPLESTPINSLYSQQSNLPHKDGKILACGTNGFILQKCLSISSGVASRIKFEPEEKKERIECHVSYDE